MRDLSQCNERYQRIYAKAMDSKGLRARIKAQCYDCMGWTDGCPSEIRACTDTGCPLYAIRPHQTKPSNIA